MPGESPTVFESDTEREFASVSGTWLPTATGRDRYTPKGGEDQPEALADRWHRAMELDAHITPAAPGIYHLTSEESGEMYFVDLDGYTEDEERAVCECSDYRYRCAEEGFDCKHIIAVKQYVRQGLLPPVGRAPVDWLHDRLDELEAAVDALREVRGSSREFDGLEERIERMRKTPYESEYRELLDAFHEIEREQGRASGKPTGAITPDN